MMSPTVAAHNLVFLSTSEIADTSNETQYKWKTVERTEEVTASAKCEWKEVAV